MGDSHFTRRRVAAAIATAGIATPVALAAPAFAQQAPEIKWRMPSSFPRSLDTLHGSAGVFIDAVRELTNGRFSIQWFGPGEIVPALTIADAVQNGTVEIGHTGSFYYIGKNRAFQIGTDIPFGMNPAGHNAWIVNGGGEQLLNDFYKQYNILGIYCGNTGAQMAGWFRKEVRSADDLKGLKMRIAGMAGNIFAKAGGVAQQIAPSDTYSALERGSIDATKFTVPADDEKLGFYRVAPFYYYPGWNDPGTGVHMFVNLKQYHDLPKSYQAALKSAGALAGQYLQTKYAVENPNALRRLIGQGTKLRALPQDVLEALAKAAKEVVADFGNESKEFKTMYESYSSFAANHYAWWQIAEFSYDAFAIRERRK